MVYGEDLGDGRPRVGGIGEGRTGPAIDPFRRVAGIGAKAGLEQLGPGVVGGAEAVAMDLHQI